MPSSDLWEALVTTALLGVDRAGGMPAIEGPIAEVAGAPGASREHALLSTAAAVDLYRRAGMAPRAGQADTPAAGAESLAAVSAKSAAHLARLLGDEFPGLLVDYLVECGRMKKRIREGMLPRLLNLAAAPGGEKLRPLVQAVLGTRGEWLIQLNAAWKNIFDPPAAADFETGARAARVRYFEHLRKSDPAGARALLEAGWEKEAPDDRAEFIGLLVTGLAMADEPFLESALDDKRKEVREAAMELLARMPGSRFSVRMKERAAAFVKVVAPKAGIMAAIKGKGKITLEVTLPEKLTPDMERDGIAGKAPSGEIGEKAGRLAKILSATPLAYFAGAAPRDVIKAAMAHEFSAALLTGWGQAAVRQGNVPWLEALCTDWIAGDTTNAVYNARTLVRAMVRQLPAEARETIVERALAAAEKSLDGTTPMEMLEACDHAWTVEFSRAALGAVILSMANQGNAFQYQVRQFVEKHAGYLADPRVLQSLAQLPATATAAPSAAAAIDALVHILQFRNDMLKELRT